MACPKMTSAQIPHDLIPRELFFKEKDKTNVHLSLDGEEIFYQKNGAGETGNSVFYIKAKAPLAEKSIEFEGEVLSFRPVYGDAILATVRQDSNLNVFLATPTSHTVRRLDIFPLREITVLQLSERFPNKIAVKVMAKEEDKSGYYALDMLSASMRRLGPIGDFEQLFFNQNFGKVAGLKRNDKGGNTIFRYHNGTWKGVRKYPWAPEMFLGGLSRIVSVSTDGRTIYATDNLGKDKTSLVSIDVATGELTEILSDADSDILPYVPTLDEKGRPLAVVSRWAEIRRHFVDDSVKADFAFLEKNMTGNVSYVESGDGGNVWLVRSMNGGPFAYFHFDRREQKLTPLFTDYSYLKDYELASRKTYSVSVRDGMTFPVNLYVPPGMAKADGSPKVPLPTIVYVHGGPWAGLKYWDRWAVDRHLQLLANRGYAVLQVEFRGTVGLGKKVCEAGIGEWGAGMHNDIVDITEWAINAGIANRKRLGIWGWSYGGYATDFALAAMPDLFTCGLSIAGVSNLKTFTEGRGEHWRALVGDPDTEDGAALLTAHSPINFVKNIKAPLLLACGGQDSRVPPSESADLAKALDDAGKDVVFFEYPDEPHSFMEPESWISFWAVAEDMLHHHVGGRKQPAGTDVPRGKMKVVFGGDYVKELE